VRLSCQLYFSFASRKPTILETRDKGVGLGFSILPSFLDPLQDLLGLVLDLFQTILTDRLGLVDILVKVLLGRDLSNKVLFRQQLNQAIIQDLRQQASADRQVAQP
jgi:hypothetical protein